MSDIVNDCDDIRERLNDKIDRLEAEVSRLTNLAQEGRKGPKVVVCCGSSRFVDVMAVCCWLLERDEGAIAMGLHLLPQWYPNVPDHHLAEHEGVAPQMDELHLRKIDLADEIFVVNCEGYIGSSTSNEIAYATKLGKPIRYFLDDKIKDTLVAMMDGRALIPQEQGEKGKDDEPVMSAIHRQNNIRSNPTAGK